MRLIDADALTMEIIENPPVYNANRVVDVIKSQPTVDGWISVKDRLPDGECIAYSTKWFEMIIGYVYKYKATASDTGYEAESENEVLRDVTHWMPLPEPPEGVTE